MPGLSRWRLLSHRSLLRLIKPMSRNSNNNHNTPVLPLNHNSNLNHRSQRRSQTHLWLGKQHHRIKRDQHSNLLRLPNRLLHVLSLLPRRLLQGWQELRHDILSRLGINLHNRDIRSHNRSRRKRNHCSRHDHSSCFSRHDNRDPG